MWVVFGSGAMTVAAALGWMTHHTLKLERAELSAQQQARFQESVRLALWRMDSLMTPLIAREAARPYFQYRPFYAAGRPYSQMLDALHPGDVLVPSPLLRLDDPLVKLNYQIDAQGAITSPQKPDPDLQRFAESGYTSAYAIATATQRLASLQGMLTPAPSAHAGANEVALAGDEASSRADAGPLWSAQPQLGGRVQSPAEPPAQIQQSASEYNARLRTTQTAQNRNDAGAKTEKSASTADDKKDLASRDRNSDGLQGRSSDVDANAPAHVAEFASADSLQGAAPLGKESKPEPTIAGPEPGVTQSAFAARWIDQGPGHEPELVFEREVDVDGTKLRQGFWLDWPALRGALLSTSRDLFPHANLVPMVGGVEHAPPEVLGLALAAIPAKFEAGASPAAPSLAWSPTRSALVITWLAAIGATAAIAIVLRESNELAERRGRFVTAVTHELRTPLSTFLMYSQMLAGGMIRDEETRTTYHHTLLRESQRLKGIVESVLEYARLGRRTGNSPRSATTAAKLVELMTPSLSSRCKQSGMDLVVETHGELGFEVVTDPPTLERIIFNLVDNACKYAGDAADRRVHLLARCEGRDLELRVRDHGPGVPPPERQSLFRPFVRGKAHADGSVPGLGLGLALAQSLAQELGGSLCLGDHALGGAEFVLRLPGGRRAGT